MSASKYEIHVEMLHCWKTFLLQTLLDTFLLLGVKATVGRSQTNYFNNDSMPAVYTRKILDKSMEKIEIMDNGVVRKSTFVPQTPFFISNESQKVHGNQDERKIVGNETLNINIVTRNGKKYKLIKVKKNLRPLQSPASSRNQIQKRSFKLLPNLLSVLPVKWLTRNQKNEKEDNELSKVHSGSEKIKKLLNLFTIVKFENGECYADGSKGECLHVSECEEKGGKFTATCAGDLGVCCFFERTCSQQSKEKCSYFVNEGFPDSSAAAPRVCTLTVDKADFEIKHLRLDFINFQLRGPVNGTCLHDKLVITGHDVNDIVPEICGTNTGQHIYVNVEDSSGPFNLNVITVGDYFPRNFRIKVSQVKKEDDLPPKNCLQYFTQPTGYIQTFNYQQRINDDLDEILTGYFNNLNYAICIKKHKGFCSITYENEEVDDSVHPTFQLINVDEEGEHILPPRQAGAETFDCPDDYIVINGIRLCGERLNDAFAEIDFTKNYPVTDTSNGPFLVSVRTDATVSGRGFYLKYTQNPCFY